MNSSYYKYYIETKNRFLIVFFTWSFALTTCYLYKEILLFILINSNRAFDSSSYFIFTNVTEIFYIYIELSLFLANQIGILMLLYQTLMFLSLGLYQFEFKKLKLTFQVFIISWLVSVILLYKFIIPFSWDFFLNFQYNSNNLYYSVSFFFEAKITEYFQYFISLYYICLLSCQFLAGLTFFFMNLDEKLKKIKIFRKLFYLIFVVFSTIITPPDVVSQIFVSVFLIIIYELLVFLQQLKTNMVIG